MAAKHDTSESGRRAGPAAHLAAAQSDAQRFVGEGPLVLWRPSSSWRRARTAGAVGLMLAAAAWWWWPADAPVDAPAGPAVIASVPQGAAPAWVLPADTAALPAAAGEAPSEAVSPACERGGCRGLTLPATAAMAPATAPVPPAMAPMPSSMASEAADPEAWALNPEPVPAANPPEFTGDSNIPPIPDENDAAPADETNPQQGEAGELADE